MKNFYKRTFLLIAAIICITVLTGCLSPIAIQAVGGAAGSAAPSASEYRGGGKGESYFIAGYEDVIQAVLNAGEALSLELKEKKVDENRVSFAYVGGKENKINLIVERRTETMTSILLDVGWTGSIAFGRLVARQIITELNEAGAFLEEWRSDSFN